MRGDFILRSFSLSLLPSPFSREKVRSCSWRTSFETMSGMSLPSRPRMSSPSLVPTVSSFFPRVPRDAFRAPRLVIRVMYGALIALWRIATELRRNRSHNYSRAVYSDRNYWKIFFCKSHLIWTFIIIDRRTDNSIIFFFFVQICIEDIRQIEFIIKISDDFSFKMLPSINCRECWHPPPLWFWFCVRQRDPPLSVLALLP